ncbi:uncharacterized protein LOC110456489 [Mizuhopecten yessoensis]|nr:uncharacterized protein LOC110456489 [Mizuhopecten yessoensis]
MGSFSDGSSQNKMSLLLRGCFGCRRKSSELSEKKTKKARLSLINRLRIRCLQRTDASETDVCKVTKEKNSVLSRAREGMNWPLLRMTERCTIFLRNFHMNWRYFQALKSEGLLVTIASSVASPVLNIAWLFTDGEITNTRQSFHSSHQKSNWDVVIYTGITVEMKANFNYDHVNEPILDGLPCSYWLEMIEPTIPIILDLFSMRHRKTNLSRLRAFEYIYEDFMTRHGDTFTDQLDPNMQGPHQLLVNRIHNTPFPTMELGTTAALVHNAMINRERQFQEPFRCRRPNHRSRCTTRPRPVSILSRRGCTPELVQDIVPNPNGSITTQNSTGLVADPDCTDSLENRDPNWYVPVILQLAACSQLQFPDGCSYRSDDDDISECSETDVVCSQGQFLDVNDTGCDNNIVGRSGMSDVCFPTKSHSVTFDDDIAGCSSMGVEPCSSEENIIGFLICKSEINEVFTTADDTSGRSGTLSAVVDEGDIDEYVDLILEKAVTSIGSIQGRLENAHDLPPCYSSSIDTTEPIPMAVPRSPSNIVFGSGETCLSTRDMEEQSIPCSPCPHLYHDECVIDEIALMNLNQSSSNYKYIGHPERCMIDACLRNTKQIIPMFHPNQHCSKPTFSAGKGGTAVPNTRCFPEDCLSVKLAMLNTNQSALSHHTQHRFRNRCEHSPDTWFYHANENVYKPETLRPDSSDLRFRKASIHLYIKEMTDANICNPKAPEIIRTFEGSRGPLGRRFFVNCATELLNEIDKKESTRWIPTKKQRWEFRNRSEVSVALVEEAANTEPELPNRQRIPVFETTQRKHTIVEGERRKVVPKKKRKTKRRNTFHVSKSKDKKETSRLAEDSTEDTDADLPGNHLRSRGDESQGSIFPFSENCTTTKETNPVCDKEKGKCDFSEKTHSAEYEHSEELWKQHIKSQNKSCNTAEKVVELGKHIEAGVCNKVHGNRTSTPYPTSIRYTRSADSQRNGRANVAGGSRSGDKSQVSRTDQLREGRNIKVNTSHHSYIGNNSTLHRRSHSQNITSTVQCGAAGYQSRASKQNLSYSKRSRQPQSKRETSSEYTTQDVTSNRSVSTKEQRYDLHSQRIYVGENEEVSSINVQPSDSTDQTKHLLKNSLACTDDSDANKNGIQHRKCPSFHGSQRPIDRQKKYVSSANDADSSSSNCKDEPKKKSKVRCRKQKTNTVQRKLAVVATGTGLYDHCNSSCFLSSESKQILANLRHNQKPKLLKSDEGTLSSENGSRQSLDENSEATPIPTMGRSQDVQNNTDQPKNTVNWSLSETEGSPSSYYGEETDYDDAYCMDAREQTNAPSKSLEKSDCKDAADEDRIGYSSSIEWNDSCWTEEEDFSYDTDVSSSDSLLGDEGYVIVNLSDTFHSDSSSRLESYTSQYTVRSGHWENRQGSGSFSSDCSLEYSSAEQNDSTTIKSPSLCYKSTGQYFYKNSDASLHSVAHNSTSVVYIRDRVNEKHSTDDESLAFAEQKEHLDSDGIVSNEEVDQDSIIKQVNREKKSITRAKQDHIPFKYLQISEGTSTPSVHDDQNECTSSETDVQDHAQDKCMSGYMSCSGNMEEPLESSADIQENSSASDSNSDERPVKLRDQQVRRFYDVGDWVTSVDAVRRHRESRRQRGILQYQWNGMYVISRMYDNPVGQRIRQQRGQFRAWLDRRQSR